MQSRTHKIRHLGGYSLIEVTIAIAIVSIGMVAIFGILPAGLNVQRDNRQETVIKYEAMYWMEVLRSGGAALPIINRVDWVEVKRGGTIFTADYTMMGADADWADPLYRGIVTHPTQLAYMKDLKRSLWRTDILGWLSAPDFGAATSDFENATDAKRVRVRSFNGPVGNPLEYIMECQVLPDPVIAGSGLNQRLCTIRLTFIWPAIDKPWSQPTPWAGANAWPLELSATKGNYAFAEVGGGRKVFTTRVAMPSPVSLEYPGRAIINTNLSLSNKVVSGGSTLYHNRSGAFGGYPYNIGGATNINRLPLSLYFFDSGDAP